MWSFNNDKPVYAQIVDEIKLRIASGQYAPGERIQSVRDLAEEARVNPNTMQKALSEIERDGYIISLRTSGKYITDDEKLIESMRNSHAQHLISSFADEINKMGISMNDAILLLQQYCEMNSNDINNERGIDSETNQGE